MNTRVQKFLANDYFFLKKESRKGLDYIFFRHFRTRTVLFWNFSNCTLGVADEFAPIEKIQSFVQI